MKSVCQDCLEFHDARRGMCVGLIPLNKVDFLPRAGEQLHLPGEDGKGLVTYKIDAIRYLYTNAPDDQEQGDVALLKITAEVTKL